MKISSMDVKAAYRAEQRGDHEGFAQLVADALTAEYWNVKEKDKGFVVIPARLARILAQHLRRPT